MLGTSRIHHQTLILSLGVGVGGTKHKIYRSHEGENSPWLCFSHIPTVGTICIKLK